MLKKADFTISGEQLFFALDLIYFIVTLEWASTQNTRNFSEKRIKNRITKDFPALLHQGVARGLYHGRRVDPGFSALHHILANTKESQSVNFNMQVILRACIYEWVMHYHVFDGPMSNYRKSLDQALSFFQAIASGELREDMVIVKRKKS